MIPLFMPERHNVEWLSALNEVFESRWIGQGPKVDEFEREFGDTFNYKYCVAVNSGSSALELAYHLIGIGPGDEVITTVLTCTATNIPLLRRGAKIIFADINDKLMISYDSVKKLVTDKTKAIVVVTLGGLGVDYRIFCLASDMGIPVVVDTAQSLGTEELFGNFLCYSFQAIKHFTTGDGGMLVCKHEADYKRAKKLRWFGIDREAKKRANWQCVVNHQMAMDIEEAGYKFHMNDIAAAMGLVGLRHSYESLEYRRKLCDAYAQGLPEAKLVYGGACWLIAMLTDRRDALMEHLRSNGIECDVVQLRNDIFTVFGGKRQDLPKMNELESQYFYLPLHSGIGLDDVDYITGTIRKWLLYTGHTPMELSGLLDAQAR